MLSPDLATTLLMPALSASVISCSQLLAVNMIIRVRGECALISRASSKPFTTDIKNHDIWIQLPHHVNRNAAIFRLTANLPVGMRFNARPNGLTDRFAVVDDKNSERHPSENPVS